MLDLSPTQMSTMTNGPGTLCYMPPEAIDENARYNCTIDAFSYGVLMVHLFNGQWPFPTKAAVIVDPQNDIRMIPQSEADRRQEKLDDIGRDHPLMTLILRCLHNSPARRPEAVEILTQVSQVAAQFLPSSQKKVELLRQVTSLRADTKRLQREHEAEIQSLRANSQRLQHEHQTEIRSLRESSSAELESTRQTLQAEIRSAQTQQREAEKAVEESQRKLEDAECCHSVEVEQLNLRLADTRDTLSSRVGEVEAKLRAAQHLISSKNSALSDRDNEMAKLTQQLVALRQQLVEKDQHLFEKYQQLVEKDLQLVEKDQNLAENAQQLQKLRDTETEFLFLLESKKVTLFSKESLVASKDSIIGGLQEQLDHLRKSHTAQVSHTMFRRDLVIIETSSGD